MTTRHLRAPRPAPVTRRDLLKYSLAAPAARSLLAGAGGAALLVGAPGQPGANAQEPNVLTFGIVGAAGTLDARRVRAIPEQILFFALYDGLVDFDQEVGIRPRLAESFERVDPTTWRFKLRQGVTFHNGEAFTADTVAFTLDQIKSLDPPFYYVATWGPAWPPTVEIESPDSVVITTPNPSPLLPNVLTRIGMLPTAATEPDFGEAPIGTGPFKFSEWVKGDRVVLEANPDYWDGRPPIDGLIQRTIPEPAAQLAALQSGEIQVAYDLPAEQLDVVTPPALNKLSVKSTGLAQVLFNFRAPDSPIADLRVRQALRLGVDGAGMIAALLPEVASPSIGPAAAACFGALDAGGYPARDVEAARALLAEAGFADGVDLTMIFTEGEFSQDTTIAEAIVSQLAEIGANVSIVELDSGQYAERRRTADWDIATNGTTGWTGDAQYYVNDVKITEGYESEALDQLILESDSAVDIEQRVALLQEAQQRLWDDVPYLWTFDVTLVAGVAGNVSGVELMPTAWMLFRQASIDA